MANQRKHGISFDEASGVFQQDAECLDIFDEEHSVTEDRFMTIGPIRRGLVLFGLRATTKDDERNP